MECCFQVGLYKQGLLHDLSKYSWTEFRTGVLYYQGTKSPNAAEKMDRGFSEAWIHHKGRNRHHFEYWIDSKIDTKEATDTPQFFGAPMPTRYVVEMFCDRIAACKVYQKEKYTDASPLEYYVKNKSHVTIHPDSAALLEHLLQMLADQGEKTAFRTIRKTIVKPRKTFGQNGRF
jgi:hypothetical protein